MHGETAVAYATLLSIVVVFVLLMNLVSMSFIVCD